MILYWTYPSIEWMVGILKYLFIGPDEKHFDVKKATKVKKLVQNIFDYECRVQKKQEVEVVIKPSSGFTATVAEAIVEYCKENPNIQFYVGLVTEFEDDFKKLPEKVQDLFKGLTSGRVYSMSFEAHGKKYGVSTAYSEVVNSGNCTVFYYEEGSKVDKAFEKEYNHILKRHSDKINLAKNFNGEAYKNEGIRKKAASLTYAYRINLTLPNGEKFTEEKAGFVVPTHAMDARNKRLVDVMWQAVEPNELTVADLFNEYIETKADTKALQEKYRQYYSAIIEGREKGKMAKQKIQILASSDTSPLAVSSRFLGFRLKFGTDNRVKNTQYDEDGDLILPYLSDKYKQGFYAMLSNLFDYAYQKKYIPYQPLLLIDLSER